MSFMYALLCIPEVIAFYKFAAQDDISNMINCGLCLIVCVQLMAATSICDKLDKVTKTLDKVNEKVDSNNESA